MANISDVNVRRFVWKNIVTRFGAPQTLILDSRLQFDSKAFCKYRSDLGIINRYSSLAYPQSNGQEEATNKMIINGLKKRLKGAKGNWAEELLSILWAYQTTPMRLTSEIPYFMTYGAEVVILVEISMKSMRVVGFSPGSNDA